MDLEHIFSHWKDKIVESKTSEQYDLTNQSDWLKKIDNIKNDLQKLETASDTEEIRILIKDILRKQLYATGLLLIGSIINEGDANDLQELKKLVIQMKNSENFDNTWPKTLYDIINNKFPTIQNLLGAEKLCLNTLGELFGKLHISKPIYNACSRNVLEKLGYSEVYTYQDFQKSFEDFKKEYQQNIGKISEDKIPINIEIDQLFNYFDKDEQGKDFLASSTKPIKYWIWSTKPESWKVVQEQSIWASSREKIGEKIHPNDKVIFYVTGTGEFQGIYEFSGEWYDAPSTVWRKTADQDVLKEIKLKPIAVGNVKVYDVANSLEVFPNTDDKKLINIVLQGGGGYPSNKGKPISKKDYLTIFNLMSADPSTMSSQSTSSQTSSKELVASILWKKLTRTDFDAINAQSNQAQSGGGARHIALGTNGTIDVASFLDVELGTQPIDEEIDVYFQQQSSKLTFRSNPTRRNGEWVISDQANNRHPAWDTRNQFPTTYDENNPPIIYVVKTNLDKLHARFIFSDQINSLDIPDFVSEEWQNAATGDKGVNPFEISELSPNSISILNELKLHHNILLYGPPGTGKTYFMQQLFSYFENNATTTIAFDDTQATQPFKKSTSVSPLPLPSISKWLTFHQSYSYEEFVIGLRPEPQGNGMMLKPKAGVLLEVSEHIKSKGGCAILFIDEINRANISSVFGEFITAIEADKRLKPDGNPDPGKTIPINLTYLGKNDEVKFADDTHKISNPYSFPYHIYVIASMNSLDRSVTPIDSALARRFFRINIEPNYDALQEQFGLANSDFDSPNSPEEVAIMLLRRVNMIISSVLGDDFQFGHSYFWNVAGNEDEKWKSVCDAFEGNIYPQLKELLRSQPDTLATILKINEGATPPDGYPYKKDKDAQKLTESLDMEISIPIVNTPFSEINPVTIKESLRFLASKNP